MATPLLALSAVSVLLHLYPMRFPLMAGGDEGAHAYYALFLFRSLRRGSLTSVAPAVALGLAIVLSIGLWGVLAPLRSRQAGWRRGINVAGILGAIAFLTWYFGLLGDRDAHLGFLRRYPPLSKFIYAAVYAVFGVSDFWIRVPQMVFSILTAAFLFKLCRLYRDEQTALLASGLFLFLPISFFFGSLAYLTSGLAFFVTVASFYFLRHVKEGNPRDLAMAAAIVGTGYLYGREVVLVFFVFASFLVLVERRRLVEGDPLFHLRMGWIALFPILPWLGMDWRYLHEYRFQVANWTQWELVMRHLLRMPHAVTYAGMLLFVIAVVYGLAKRRDGLTWYALLWFGVWYVVMTTSDVTATPGYLRELPRLMFPAYPVMAILIAQMVKDYATTLAPEWGFRVGATALVGYFLLGATILPWPPLDPVFVAYRDTASRFLPYGEAVHYVKESIPENQRVLAVGEPTLWFYVIKYDVRVEWVHQMWAEPARQTLEGLREFAKAGGIQYVLLATGPWHQEHINEGIVRALLSGENRGFRAVKTFYSGRNAMVLSQVL